MSNAELAVLQCGNMSGRWAWLEYIIFVIRNSATHLNQEIRTGILHDSCVMLGMTMIPDVVEYFGQLVHFRPAPSGVRAESVSTVLRAFRGLKATDPRDNVFALLGLGDDDAANLPEINYSIPLMDVYRSTMTYLIEQCVLNILSEAGLYDLKLHGLPSWVVDWISRPHGLSIIGSPEAFFMLTPTP